MKTIKCKLEEKNFELILTMKTTDLHARDLVYAFNPLKFSNDEDHGFYFEPYFEIAHVKEFYVQSVKGMSTALVDVRFAGGEFVRSLNVSKVAKIIATGKTVEEMAPAHILALIKRNDGECYLNTEGDKLRLYVTPIESEDDDIPFPEEFAISEEKYLQQLKDDEALHAQYDEG